jgi:UDP-N-acetylmuramoyl-tripeptide--D-alanyl-D-alanine ligase
MMTLSLAAKMMNGELRGADVEVSSVSNDTRTLDTGALYFAIRGERFDGHEYLQQARAAGAAGAVVDAYRECDIPQIAVDDTRKALGRLAGSWRHQFKGKIVGVTGSNGKTTVKEMIAAVLAKQGDVLATRGNYNNDIGLPLTLMRLRDEKFAVIEMGANHPGEIAGLTAIAQPDVAVITNAGPAHLEGFGSLEGVAHAKGEIYGGLRTGGVAVINADDNFSAYWRALNTQRKVVTFGLKQAADIKGEWQPRDTGGELKIKTATAQYVIHLPVPGQHNAMNALAAIAAATTLGISHDDAHVALENFKPVKGRLNFHQTRIGARLIDDTYNANPASLQAGLQVLCELPGEHWLILGDMGELGDDSVAIHAEAGHLAKKLGVQRMLAVGVNSRHAVESFGQGAEHFASQDELVAWAQKHLHDKLNILIKGSRFMRMENVVAALIGEQKKCC